MIATMQKNTMRLLATLLLVAVFAGACNAPAGVGLTDKTLALSAPTSTPGPVLDVEAVDLAGKPTRLSDYRGKVVLINFWASWCTPCKAEMPVLAQYYQDHAGDGFVLIGLNTGENAEDGARFMRDNGFDFPAWSDPPGNLLIKLGVNGLPFSILVDREGRRIARWYGEADRERLDKIITPLLDAD